MTAGSRIVFMRFATSRSPKLALWIDHFDRVVGHGPRVVNSLVTSQDECIVVWQLVSANNRMLARSANLFERFEDAQADAQNAAISTAEREFVLTSHQRRGEYGWYAAQGGEVEMIGARWYGTERDRRNAIELAESSLAVSHLASGARPIDPQSNRAQPEYVAL